MTRYTMAARSRGRAYMQRRPIERERNDVRRRLTQRLDVFYCDLQARTHVVLQNTPPLTTIAQDDEAVSVDAHGMKPTEIAKAVIEATGLNPHLSVCGRPSCASESDGDENEGGAI